MHILCDQHCQGFTGARLGAEACSGGAVGVEGVRGEGVGGNVEVGQRVEGECKLAAVHAAAYLVQGDGSTQLVSFNLAAGNLLLQRQYLRTGM